VSDEKQRPDFGRVASEPARPDPDTDTVLVHQAEPPPHPTVEALRERFGDAIRRYKIASGDQHVVYIDPSRTVEILGFLKNDPEQHFDLLADVTAVDYGGGAALEVVYQLWSIPHRRGLRVKGELPLDALNVDSVVGLWKAANWLEREVFDLFGIRFDGHPDLRRILMPENYAEGHPLRKDFPLRGRFSRAEQTRRALLTDLDSDYTSFEAGTGGEPQVVDGPTGGDQ